MIRRHKGVVFGVCSLGVILMHFVAGCEENVSKVSEKPLPEKRLPEKPEKDRPDASSEWDGVFPLVISEPCPFENMTYFMKREHIIPQENTVKYYLVDTVDGHTKPRIYLIDDQEGMDRVYRWLMRNLEKLEEVSYIANFPHRFPWHDELLQYAKNGDGVSYSFIDSLEQEKHKKLVAIFREVGKQVDAVPGRKPPEVRADGKLPAIEWIIDEESANNKYRKNQ